MQNDTDDDDIRCEKTIRYENDERWLYEYHFH